MKKITLFAFLLFAVTGNTFSQNQPIKPTVQRASYFDVSPPLRDMLMQTSMKADNSWKDGVVKNMFNVRKRKTQESPFLTETDPSVQNFFGPLVTDTTLQNFEGLNGGSYIPPDTDGDVGHDYYFQVVNCSYAIYNKNGIKVFGPYPNSSVWTGMPHNSNDGDAVVLFDEEANRWFFSQFSLPSMPNGPFYQMIAVSQTPDPTGSWYRWEYYFSSMPDYPKFGIWPDGYYMSCNRFSAGSTGYVGTGAAAFDRSAMLAGDPDAQMIYFTLPSNNEAFSLLPADCDGEFPPYGTPNYFTYEYDETPYHLGILEFHADWETPAASTFGNLLSLPVTSFNPSFGGGISQLGTSAKLSTLSDRLMFRQQFRKFNDRWSMVLNHSVNTGSGVAGIRWYELRKTTGAWGVHQQSTFAPGDGRSRWMGSIAMDSSGNIALGYSVSSSSMYPAIRYTGRMKNDPLNQMSIAESGIINGGGSQTSNTNRWGDYSSMRIDPSNPTTFWYTTEYYAYTSSNSWTTRIASFTFENVYSAYASAGPELVCNGDSVQLYAFANGGTGNYTYSWTSNPSGFVSTMKNPKTAPLVDTKYMAVISDGNNTTYDTTAVIEVKQYAYAFAGNDTTVCSYLPSIDVQGVCAYYRTMGWGSTGDGHFTNPNTFNTTYIFGPQDYLNDSVDLILVAIPYPPCFGNKKSIKKVRLDPCTGMEHIKGAPLTLTVLPNPATDRITVEAKGLKGESARLTIRNIQGEMLFAESYPTEILESGKTVDVSSFAKGLYIIQIQTTTRIQNQSFIIQ
jgi:hypothetical protein